MHKFLRYSYCGNREKRSIASPLVEHPGNASLNIEDEHLLTYDHVIL